MRPHLQRNLQVTVWLSILALAASCGRYQPGEYTGGDGLGASGSSQSTPDKDDEDEQENEAPDCRKDWDGSRSELPFAIVEIGLGEDGYVEVANTLDEPLYVFSTNVGGQTTHTVVSQEFPINGRFLVDFPFETSGELFLVTEDDDLIQYACWGQQPVTDKQNEAVALGLWTTSGVCIQTPASGKSLHLTGAGFRPADWTAATPTPSSCP